MAKISIGLRGWRFEETAVFDGTGEIRPLAEMDEDTRHRLVRLSAILGEPCNACWLVHGEEEIKQCNPAEIVYGEPLAEVLLCGAHEADFLYWFREAGGSDYAGSADLQDRFHEWFLDGGRAPAEYAGLDHQDRQPDALPEVTETESIPAVDEQVEKLGDAEREALGVDLDNLDV